MYLIALFNRCRHLVYQLRLYHTCSSRWLSTLCRRLLSYSTTTDPDLPRWYKTLSHSLTMLSVKTEHGPASPALLSSPGVQIELDLWNHRPASSLDMEKKSPPLSQPSNRRGRGDRPDSTRSASTPSAQVNAAPASSAVRQLNNNVFP